MVKDKYEDIKWSDLVEYSDSSGSRLRWLIEIRTGKDGRIVLTEVGQDVGSVSNEGRWQFGFNGKTYSVAKVVWILHYGQVESGLVIDHIDGNPLNNSVSNLRKVAQTDNRRNSAGHSNNKSGVTGVHHHKTKTNEYWTATWVDTDGKCRSKHFSISKLGYEKAFDLAVEYRKSELEKLNLSGAGYTDRHGNLFCKEMK